MDQISIFASITSDYRHYIIMILAILWVGIKIVVRKITKQLQSIGFICSPSLGILDNWLPVIVAIREKLPKSKIFFIINKILSLSINNIVHKITIWYQATHFVISITINQNVNISYILYIWNHNKYFSAFFIKYKVKNYFLICSSGTSW